MSGVLTTKDRAQLREYAGKHYDRQIERVLDALDASEEALAWYADESNYLDGYCTCSNYSPASVMADSGGRAIDTLAKIRGGK